MTDSKAIGQPSATPSGSSDTASLSEVVSLSDSLGEAHDGEEMSDFSKPEYASYVALCRELRLERNCQVGDWLLFRDDSQPGVVGGAAGSFPLPPNTVWLPSLSDWLEMLEGAGQPNIEIGQSFDRDQKQDGYIAYGDTGTPWERTLSFGSATCPTREEAAARLWMAVREPAPVT